VQLLGLVAAGHALKDAGYGPERAFDRNRTSVILGVTGALELVIPLGARLGHPIWRRALQEAGVEGSVAGRTMVVVPATYCQLGGMTSVTLTASTAYFAELTVRVNVAWEPAAVGTTCGLTVLVTPRTRDMKSVPGIAT